MKIEGQYEFKAKPREVWDALLNPEVLATTLPGARSLEVVGPDRYKIVADVGVGSVKGVYDGIFAIEDKHEPESCLLKGSARGAGGSIEVEARSRLSDLNGGGTLLTYSAEARLGGAIGGVGQRMIGAASKRMSSQFFGAIDRNIAGEVVTPAPSLSQEPPAELGRVYSRPAAAASDNRNFVLGMLVGFALALIGVAVGRRTAR